MPKLQLPPIFFIALPEYLNLRIHIPVSISASVISKSHPRFNTSQHSFFAVFSSSSQTTQSDGYLPAGRWVYAFRSSSFCHHNLSRMFSWISPDGTCGPRANDADWKTFFRKKKDPPFIISPRCNNTMNQINQTKKKGYSNVLSEMPRIGSGGGGGGLTATPSVRSWST